jgi:hypothetical protein
MGRRAEAIAAPAALALQGPFLAYLSGQPPSGFAALSVASAALAAALRGILLRGKGTGPFRTLFLNLTLGSLGMLVGWYADAGLGPLVGRGICLCGCGDSLVGLGVVGRFHWMQACMLVACTAATLAEQPARVSHPLRAAGRVLASSLLMLAGMASASWVTATLQMADPRSALVASYLSMTAGMAAGCALAAGMAAMTTNCPGAATWGPSLSSK